MSLLDEDVIEGAFWHFDAERKRTGAERDAFKHQLRLVVRAHMGTVLKALERANISLTAYTTQHEPPGGLDRARIVKQDILRLLTEDWRGTL